MQDLRLSKKCKTKLYNTVVENNMNRYKKDNTNLSKNETNVCKMAFFWY